MKQRQHWHLAMAFGNGFDIDFAWHLTLQNETYRFVRVDSWDHTEGSVPVKVQLNMFLCRSKHKHRKRHKAMTIITYVEQQCQSQCQMPNAKKILKCSNVNANANVECQSQSQSQCQSQQSQRTRSIFRLDSTSCQAEIQSTGWRKGTWKRRHKHMPCE